MSVFSDFCLLLFYSLAFEYLKFLDFTFYLVMKVYIFFAIIFNSYLLSFFEPFSLFINSFKQLIPWFFTILLSFLNFYMFLIPAFIFLIFKIHSTVEKASDFCSIYPAAGIAGANVPKQEEVWGAPGTEEASSVGDTAQAAQTNINK